MQQLSNKNSICKEDSMTIQNQQSIKQFTLEKQNSQNNIKNQINNIPQNIQCIGIKCLEIIGSYLDSKSQNNLSQTCRKMKYMFSGSSYTSVINCLAKFFPSDIEYFIDCGDESEYLAEKKKKDYQIAKSCEDKQFYSNCLMKYSKITFKWKVIWERFNEQNQYLEYSQKLLSVLRDPPLPILKLRRENIGLHCQTWMQNDLAEILYDGGSSVIGFAFDDDNILKDISKMFKSQKERIFSELKTYIDKSDENKQSFLKLRWYDVKYNEQEFFKSESEKKQEQLQQGQNLNNSEQQQQNNNNNLIQKEEDQNQEESDFDSDLEGLEDMQMTLTKQPTTFIQENSKNIANNNNNQNDILQQIPLIIEFHQNLYIMLENQVQLIGKYLIEHIKVYKNSFDLISEYNLKWSTFVACLHELEDNMKDYFTILNQAYEQFYPEYPSFPKISLWRIMGKLWNKHVYEQEQLQQHMFACFGQILTERRKENLQFQINQGKIEEKLQNAYYMPTQLDSVPLNMQTNFTKSQKFDFRQSLGGEKQSTDIIQRFEYDHSYFSKNSYQVDQLLSNFVESILDISLNEINVHYLGHTQIETEKPYLDLENMILKNCKQFYKYQYKNLFKHEKLSLYFNFLDGDIKYLSKVFKERTLHRVRQIQINYWEKMFFRKLKHKILDSVFFISKSEFQFQNHGLNNYYNNVLEQQEVEEEKQNFCQKNNNNLEEMEHQQNMEQDQESEDLIQEQEIEELQLKQQTLIRMDSKGIKLRSHLSQFCKKDQDSIMEIQELFLEQYKLCVQKPKYSNIIQKSNYSEKLQMLAIEIFQDKGFQEDLKCLKTVKIQQKSIQEEKCEQDQEIEELNNWRKIPKSLSVTEQLFYSINGVITIEILKNLVNEKKIKNGNLSNNNNTESSRQADSEQSERGEYSEYYSEQDNNEQNMNFQKNQKSGGKMLEMPDPNDIDFDDEDDNDDLDSDGLPEMPNLKKTISQDFDLQQMPILSNRNDSIQLENKTNNSTNLFILSNQNNIPNGQFFQKNQQQSQKNQEDVLFSSQQHQNNLVKRTSTQKIEEEEDYDKFDEDLEQIMPMQLKKQCSVQSPSVYSPQNSKQPYKMLEKSKTVDFNAEDVFENKIMHMNSKSEEQKCNTNFDHSNSDFNNQLQKQNNDILNSKISPLKHDGNQDIYQKIQYKQIQEQQKIKTLNDTWRLKNEINAQDSITTNDSIPFSAENNNLFNSNNNNNNNYLQNIPMHNSQKLHPQQQLCVKKMEQQQQYQQNIKNTLFSNNNNLNSIDNVKNYNQLLENTKITSSVLSNSSSGIPSQSENYNSQKIIFNNSNNNSENQNKIIIDNNNFCEIDQQTQQQQQKL